MEDRKDGAEERSWAAQPWLWSSTIAALAELNEQFLELCIEQAARDDQEHAQPLLRDLRLLWRRLDSPALRRAAECPYLLVDVGFADRRLWTWAGGRLVSDSGLRPAMRFFTGPRATTVARLVFTYGWHLARSQSAAARILVGMQASCAGLIASCTLRQMGELAERYPEWLQPRWPGRLEIWRELLTSAAAGDGLALERARFHGLQLLAAEARRIPAP